MEKTIPYSDLPGSTELFSDYIHRFESVKSHYSEDYRDPSRWEGLSNRIGEKKYERERLVEILKEQNLRLECGEKTLKNIELLKDPKTLAIFTGQQIGLFTGPLYTLYKALTACKLSKILHEKTSRKVVPLFWMESDDHNPREVNHISFLDPKNKIAQLKVEMEEGRKPVGNILLKGKIERTLEFLENMELESEFRKNVFKFIKTSYLSSEDFAEGFGRMMAVLFKDYGLIFVNSLETKWQDIAAPFFQKTIEHASEIKDLLTKQSDKLLQDGYHNQIEENPEILDLFALYKGERVPIRIVNDELKVGNSALRNLHTEIRYSPNVALRPILQDWLFPTVAYVAGPSEIAYFAQLKPLYEFFNVEMPVIFPRTSFTLLEKSIVKVLEKYDLSVSDFFGKTDDVIQKIMKSDKTQKSQADEIFDKLDKCLSQSFSGLGEEFAQVDPSLTGSLENSQKKILYQLGKLRHGFFEGEKKKNEILVRQIERASNQLYPEGQLQERKFNIVHYLVRYGMDFLSRLEKEIDPFDFAHKVVRL